MKQIASRFDILLHSIREINFTKAKPKTVAPALAHKSNDWITLA